MLNCITGLFLKKKGLKASMPVRETGIVMWFDASKCYGLITRDKGGDVFVKKNPGSNGGRHEITS